MRYPIGGKAELKAPPKAFRVIGVDLILRARNFVIGFRHVAGGEGSRYPEGTGRQSNLHL